MLDCKKINVGIMDLGINNIFSISQLFKNLGCKTEIYKKKNKGKYHLVVIPGVGSYNQGMKSLVEKKYKDDILEFYKKKKNIILGICLGMQLFFEKSSEFKSTKGLCIIKGQVKKIPKKTGTKTHIGWKKIIDTKNYIFKKNKEAGFYYFVHSFYCDVKNKSNIIFRSSIKNFSFVSGVKQENLIGLQFHPEKSGSDGVDLINKILKKVYEKNFI